MGLKWVCYVQPGLVNHGPCSLHAHGDPNVSELKAWIVTMEFKLAQITQLLVKMSGFLGLGESLSRIKSNGKRAQQPAYRGRNRFTVWGSRVSGHWGTLVDYSVPRVVITVSPARVASSNMGKGSPHDEGST